MEKKIIIDERYQIPETSEGLVVPLYREKLVSENEQLPEIIKNTQDLVEIVAFNMEGSLSDFFHTLLEKVQKYDVSVGTIEEKELAFFRSFLVLEVYEIYQKVKEAEAKWQLNDDDTLEIEPILDQEILDSLGKLGALGNILNITLQTRYKARRAIATIDTSIKNTEERIEDIEKIPEERRSPAQNNKLKQYGKTLDSNKSKKEIREGKLEVLESKIDEVLIPDKELDEVWKKAKELLDYIMQNYKEYTADLDKDKLLELEDFKEALKLTLPVDVEQFFVRTEGKEAVRKGAGLKNALMIGLTAMLVVWATAYMLNRTAIPQNVSVREHQKLQRQKRQLEARLTELKGTKERARKRLASYCETLFRNKITRNHGKVERRWLDGSEPVINMRFPELGKETRLIVGIKKYEKKEIRREKYLYETEDNRSVEATKSIWKGEYTLKIILSAKPNDPLEKVVTMNGFTFLPFEGNVSGKKIDMSRLKKVSD